MRKPAKKRATFQPKNETIRVRVTSQEKEKLEAEARSQNYPTLSNYARLLLLKRRRTGTHRQDNQEYVGDILSLAAETYRETRKKMESATRILSLLLSKGENDRGIIIAIERLTEAIKELTSTYELLLTKNGSSPEEVNEDFVL